MRKFLILFSLLSTSALAGENNFIEKFKPTEIDKNGINLSSQSTFYTFLILKVINEKGDIENEKFFVGALPKIGEAVEMIYVGNENDGGMRFQLRTK